MNSYFKLPEPYKDGITSTVDIYIGWKDRVRLLLGGMIHIEVVILVENTPGRMQSKASVRFVRVPTWLEKVLLIRQQRESEFSQVSKSEDAR